jgi:hypothetical protein
MTIPFFITQDDLQQRKISSSAKQTRYLTEKHGFPIGRMISPNIRAWTEQEIADWLKARPTEAHCNIPPEKRPRGRPRKQIQPQSTQAA